MTDKELQELIDFDHPLADFSEKHNTFDPIMEVLIALEEHRGYYFLISKYACEVRHIDHLFEYECYGKSKIEAVYNAVVKTIIFEKNRQVNLK